VQRVAKDLEELLLDKASTAGERLRFDLAAERNRHATSMAAEREDLAAKRSLFDAERVAWEAQRAEIRQAGLGMNDLIGLNFGGEKIITVKRALLVQMEGTLLEGLFSGRFEDCLDRHTNGNVFFDYSPHVMGPLIEYLRLCRDAGPGERVEQPTISEKWTAQWRSMVYSFGIEEQF